MKELLNYSCTLCVNVQTMGAHIHCLCDLKAIPYNVAQFQLSLFFTFYRGQQQGAASLAWHPLHVMGRA